MNNLFFQWLSGSVDGDGDEDDGHIDQLVYLCGASRTYGTRWAGS